VKLHTTNLKTPKMTRKKLKTLEPQNSKTKSFKVHKKKKRYPLFPLVKLHTIFLKTPKMMRRKFEDSRTLNTKTKNLQTSQEEN
jgi:hypothetical protein